jgi:cobalt-zinc-cadmium efflux system membrane fusion protein
MPRRMNVYIPATFLCVTFLVSACGSKPEAQMPQAWALTDSLLHTLAIDTATSKPIENEILLTGKIAANEDMVARIFPMVSGNVTAVKVHSGDFVQKGQTLAVIKSAEMAGFTADNSIAESEMKTAKRSMEVAASFYQSGLSSEKEYEMAKSEYDKTVANYKKSIEILAINGGHHQADYLVKSPLPGFIISKKAAEHMQWRQDNADPIFVVADLKNVWAMISVFESDVSSIHEGDAVEMTTLAYPDKTFTGKIDKIYNVLDPENKVMKAKVVVNNPDFLLKPEMFVRVKARRHHDSEMLAIPSRGIIFDHDKYYVLVLKKEAPGAEIREIKVAKTVDGRAYLSAGLQEGDRIIASRQVFIYETLSEAQSK